MTEPRFSVGIDLGTTHTVVASCQLAREADPEPTVFLVPQLVTTSSSSPLPLLPSLLYAPLEAEDVRDPWGDPPWVTGELARLRGVEAPGRLVASAKSWLSHAAVDRTAPILPYGGDGSCPTISPCDASAAILLHVRRAWDEVHPDAPLAEQDVVLTVPASFDEVARELTLTAASRAGLSVRLLEEPQAAFYDYRRRAGDTALAELLKERAEARVLVCDVGGGTTDLSLLRVTPAPGPQAKHGVEVTRVAVGRHLLLGGDNMDLALAHAAESRMSETPLDPGRHGQLVLAVRAAKEALLAEPAPDDVGVSVAAPGARLIGGTRSARVTQADIEALVLEAFFPVVPRDAEPVRARSGLLGFGLPYERDVAITRHVAAFFGRHSQGGSHGAAEAHALHAVLLNGGVFHARRIVERLSRTLDGWGGGPVAVLPHADPDLAVARGAVAYALARRGSGVARIGSGAARGYYIEVARDAPAARAVVCVVPRGTEEGTPQVASATPLGLVVGRPARFDLYASDNATGHRAGEVVELDAVDVDPLPPVFAAFDAEAGGDEHVRVLLQGELSAIGTLDLSCVELEPRGGRPPRRFRLAFGLRGDSKPSIPPPSTAGPRSVSSRRIDEATAAIDRVFGKSTKGVPERETKDLVRELERIHGERGRWDTPTARAVFDAVWRGHKGRRRSLDHERVFWQLAGFCLRPGMGDVGDGGRVAALFPLFGEKLAFVGETRGWQQFWFAWRRVAAGLDEASQTAIRDAVDPLVAPPDPEHKGGRKRATSGWRAEALDALLEMVCSLERVPPARKAELGGWIIERTWTDRDPRLWAALGRLGGRVPAYAAVNYAVGTVTVERWLDHLLREKWGEVPTAAEAALRMARVTGDRARDLSERMRRDVARRLSSLGTPAERVRTVTELVEVEEADRVAFFGEGMPVGLQLMRT